MLTTVLLKIAKNRKPPKYPTTGEEMNKMWYAQTMEYNSAIKRDETLKYAPTWMNFKNIVLSERC